VEPFGPHCELARDKTEADIRAFAVSPQAQGRGVGRALLQTVIAAAARDGLTTLRLCTQPAMAAAQRLYAAAGFTRTPDLDWEPVPGLTLRAYALVLAAPATGR
jgi:ribosomal protein S18 acetylase RimI-like enzyme